jgi:hypothetical protein
MQGFQAKPVPINDVDVVSGRPDALVISLTTNLFNPSNMTISLGPVNLYMAVNKTVLGTITLKDFTTVPGDNPLSPETVLSPASNPEVALALLGNFIEGKDQQVQVVGKSDSTPVESFKEALASIAITSTLHGLKVKMIDSLSLEILDSTLKDGVASGTVVLVNPFSASVAIHSIASKATFQGLPLGEINVDLKQQPIVVKGKSNLTAPGIPVKMNLDPTNLTKVLIAAAKKCHIDLGPIIGSLTSGSVSLRKRDDQDIADLILKALNCIDADVDFSGLTSIDQFQAPLSFSLTGIPVHMDESALKLIALLGGPLVAKNIEQSKLVADTAVITNLRADKFTMEFKGKITDAGVSCSSSLSSCLVSVHSN